ncbi:MAG: hypothetical protein OQK24_02185 [Magnetovibrio sp.]|nr:hypothetical protein [Magnetovibrio sp.]
MSASQKRQIDSRRFETSDEVMVLNAIVALLQDTGFKVGETDLTTGLVSGSKGSERGTAWFGSNIRITVTTTPVKDGSIQVRATFQDIITGRDPRFYRGRSSFDPALYQNFFDKLSQSLFLEAHSL